MVIGHYFTIVTPTITTTRTPRPPPSLHRRRRCMTKILVKSFRYCSVHSNMIHNQLYRPSSSSLSTGTSSITMSPPQTQHHQHQQLFSSLPYFPSINNSSNNNGAEPPPFIIKEENEDDDDDNEDELYRNFRKESSTSSDSSSFFNEFLDGFSSPNNQGDKQLCLKNQLTALDNDKIGRDHQLNFESQDLIRSTISTSVPVASAGAYESGPIDVIHGKSVPSSGIIADSSTAAAAGSPYCCYWMGCNQQLFTNLSQLVSISKKVFV